MIYYSYLIEDFIEFNFLNHMKKYEPKEFTIPELKGISQTTIQEHLGLYKGYVKNMNHVQDILADTTIDAYAKSEARRRQSFEYNGMKNHEYYFAALQGGAQDISPDSKLALKIREEWGSIDAWKEAFTSLAKTRGVGWAMLMYDTETGTILNNWVDEQHLGHLIGAQPILCMDMWEHSFVADYQPSGKGQYIEDYLSQINWGVIEENFENATK